MFKVTVPTIRLMLGGQYTSYRGTGLIWDVSIGYPVGRSTTHSSEIVGKGIVFFGRYSRVKRGKEPLLRTVSTVRTLRTF